MPELPEVETVARQLAPLLSGRTIRRGVCLDPKLAADWWATLRGARIAGVSRLGKQVVLQLTQRNGGERWLAVHLRMTGRLAYEDGPGSARAPQRPHLRFWLSLDQGALALYDPRRFATVTLHEDVAQLTPAGLDPTSRAFTQARLATLARGSAQPLKQWLLRQDKLVGIGNIYASEILFAARLHPERPAGSLAPQELAALQRCTKRILQAAIRHCGTTFRDFQDAHGATGGYARYLKVYQRGGQPCLTCGTPIERIVQQQRATYYCPACQAGP